MDSSTSPNEHANVQRQESPMSVQEQPIVGLNGNGTTATVAETMTSSGVATLMPDSGSDEVAATILTPEQEEERKLRLKYPNPQKPGGSTFIQKMLLHKGCKKYFDSGDYNMAKSRTKAHVTSNGANGTTTQAPPMPNSGCLVAPQRISEELSTPNTSTNFSPNLSQSQNSTQSRLSTSPQTNTSSLNSSTAVQPSSTPQIDGVSTPSTTSSNSSHHYHNHHSHNHQYNQQQTPSLHSRLSSTNINNSSPLVLFPSSSSSSSSSSSTTSTSTSSLHQSGGQQAARQLLSSSTSASNIMGSAAAMQVDPVLLNAADEIGHGIPTPECLPQSRKHAISQSKLATPRLSTS